MPGRVPLHGYNTNYRKQGQVYHVQTEDLGDPLTAIVTQVFTGGTILGKKRTEYHDLLEADNFEEFLRERMQKQHKAMLVALRDDRLVEVGDPVASAAPPSEQAQPEAAAKQPSVTPEVAPVAPATVEAPNAPAPPAIPTGDPMRDTVQMELPPEFYHEIDAGAPDEDGILIEDLPPAETPVPPPIPAEAAAPPPPQKAPAPPAEPAPKPAPQKPAPKPAPRKPAPKPAPRKPAPTRVEHSPPPVPAASLSGLRMPASRSDAPAAPMASSEPPAQRADRPDPQKVKSSSVPPQSSGRPRIFAEISKPMPGFGEEQVGEHSLDEVILSYLADDLQED